MPVKLPNSSFAQVLLRASNVLAGGEILYDLLPHPATVEETGLGVGETPLEVRHDAIVGRLLTQVVRVLKVELLVGAT